MEDTVQDLAGFLIQACMRLIQKQNSGIMEDGSADGQTLYIVDATSKRLQVITLANDAAGEEE